MNNKGIIFNIQKFSLQDGPGIRTSIFLKGCPLACKWCANPESQNPYANLYIQAKDNTFRIDIKDKEINFDEDGYVIENDNFETFIKKYISKPEDFSYQQVGRVISTDRIVDICLKDKVFYDKSNGGVTISGGEPTYQIDFLIELLTKLKKSGIHTAIETTAFNSMENIKKLYNLIDLFIIDIKHWNFDVHKKYTSVSNELILNNISDIIKNANDYLIRIPVIPDFNFSNDDTERFISLFKDMGIEKVELLPFHQLGEGKYENYGINYTYKDVKALNKDDLSQMLDIFTKSGINAFA